MHTHLLEHLGQSGYAAPDNYQGSVTITIDSVQETISSLRQRMDEQQVQGT